MRCSIICYLIFFSTAFCVAQVETPKATVQFEATEPETNFETPQGLQLPAIKTPGLSIEKDPYPLNNSTLGEENKAPVDFAQQDGLMDYTTNDAPKAFTKDKEADKAFGRDQSLGDVTTTGREATVMFRDHQFVDGDRIRVLVNGDIIRANEYLDNSFKGVTITLDEGINRIEFMALNTGSSGPNTAELHVYDANGLLISAEEWNLLTGYKATIIVKKE